MADIEIKQWDTYPPLKATLEMINQETGVQGPINLKTGGPSAGKYVKVTAIFKPPGKAAKEIVSGSGLTIVSEAKGEIEVKWPAEFLSETGVWKLEFEIEWVETGGIKQYQSVPNNGFRTIEVLAEIGTAK